MRKIELSYNKGRHEAFVIDDDYRPCLKCLLRVTCNLTWFIEKFKECYLYKEYVVKYGRKLNNFRDD